MIPELTLRKIVVCPTCKGRGKIKVGNLIEFHNHDTEQCPDCQGDGILERIVTKKYEKL